MPLVAEAFKGILIGSMASKGILGQYAPNLADAISQGVTNNILAEAIVQTIDTGVSGAGVGISKVLGINQGILTPLMIGQFSQNGLLGEYGLGPLPSAISEAFATWFTAGNITSTIHAGVGQGVGIGKVFSLVPQSMQAMILGFMVQNGINGTYNNNVAAAVAGAIVPHILSAGIVTVPIQGVGILPSAGTGIGKIL